MSQTQLLDLPDDAIVQILQAMPFTLKRTVALVSRRLHRLVSLPWAFAQAPCVHVSLLGAEHGSGKSSLTGLLLDSAGSETRTAAGLVPLLSSEERATGAFRALPDRLTGIRAAPRHIVSRWTTAVTAGADLTIVSNPNVHYASWARARAAARFGGRQVMLSAAPCDLLASRTALRVLFSADVAVFAINIGQVSQADTLPRRRLEELLTCAYTLRLRHVIVALTHADEATTAGAMTEQLDEAVRVLRRLSKAWHLPLGTLVAVPVSALTGENVVAAAAHRADCSTHSAMASSPLASALATYSPSVESIALDLTDADAVAQSRVVLPRTSSLYEVLTSVVGRVNQTHRLAKAAAPLQFAVDDVFRVVGVGAVVTGTVLRGTVSVDRTLNLGQVSGSPPHFKVKSMQHPLTRQAITTDALPGDYVALSLATLSTLTVSGHLARHKVLVDAAAKPDSPARVTELSARLCVTDAAISKNIQAGWTGLAVFAGGLEIPLRLTAVERYVKMSPASLAASTAAGQTAPLWRKSAARRINAGDVVEARLCLGSSNAVRTLSMLSPNSCFVMSSENRIILAGRVLKLN